MLPRINAIRYVTPLREGGSLPGLIEANDFGTYVVKFRGAGQGLKALVAEVVTGELARALDLPVPDLRVVELDPIIGRSEPDEEVQDLLTASGGSNLGMDFLPGAIGFEPLAHRVDADLAARVLWLDAFTENVDRSWRNPNLLMWHGDLWLIDHGATLYFHHNWATAATVVHRPYRADDHVLRAFAVDVEQANAELAPNAAAALEHALSLVPDEWLTADGVASAAEARARYSSHLLTRLAEPAAWLPRRAAA